MATEPGAGLSGPEVRRPPGDGRALQKPLPKGRCHWQAPSPRGPETPPPSGLPVSSTSILRHYSTAAVASVPAFSAVARVPSSLLLRALPAWVPGPARRSPPSCCSSSALATCTATLLPTAPTLTCWAPGSSTWAAAVLSARSTARLWVSRRRPCTRFLPVPTRGSFPLVPEPFPAAPPLGGGQEVLAGLGVHGGRALYCSRAGTSTWSC